MRFAVLLYGVLSTPLLPMVTRMNLLVMGPMGWGLLSLIGQWGSAGLHVCCIGTEYHMLLTSSYFITPFFSFSQKKFPLRGHAASGSP